MPIQDDMGRSCPVPGIPSRPASRNAFDDSLDTIGSAEAELANLRRELKSTDGMRSGSNGQSSSAVHTIGPPSSYSYAAALGASLSRSTTPDPQLVARAPSPCPTPIGGGRVVASEKRSMTSANSFSGVSSGMNESADLAAALSGMNLSNGLMDDENQLLQKNEQDAEKHQNYFFGMQGSQNQIKQQKHLKKSELPQAHQSPKMSYSDLAKSNGAGQDLNNSSLLTDRQIELQKAAVSSNNSYMKGSPTSTLNGGGGLGVQYQHIDNMSNYGLGGYSLNPSVASLMANQLGTSNVSPLYDNFAAASATGVPGMDSRMLGGGLASGQNLKAASESHNLNRMGNQLGGGALQTPFVDPMYLQYLRTSEYAAQLAALNDPSVDRNFLGNSYMNLIELQKAYLGAMLSPQKSPYGVQMGGKSGASNHLGYGSPTFGLGMSYPGSPLAAPVLPNSPVGPGSPIRHEANMRYPSAMRNLAGGVMGGWHLDGAMDESFASSLLEEFKSNKAKCFELAEIAGHVVEFRYIHFPINYMQNFCPHFGWGRFEVTFFHLEQCGSVWKPVYPTKT